MDVGKNQIFDMNELFKDQIVVVSGLPRSGTSLLMALLKQAGLTLLVDQHRLPDDDNPGGYFEYEPINEPSNSFNSFSDIFGGMFWLR